MKKKILLFIFCLLIFIGCTRKKEEPIQTIEIRNENNQSLELEDRISNESAIEITEGITQMPDRDSNMVDSNESPVTQTITSEPLTPTNTTEYVADPVKIRGNVGDIILFGSYEQDNNLSNGAEPIEWIVLSNDGEKMLLLSKYALDNQPYHSIYESVTWENCSLRNWLNNDFYNSAFKASEKATIRKSTIKNEDNPKYGTEGGNDTIDRVFLLSLSDIINTKYGFSEDIENHDVSRRCAPTAYAITQGAVSAEKEMASRYGDTKTKDGEYACWWWLRSPGNKFEGLSNKAAHVGVYGNAIYEGVVVSFWSVAVRPAIYITIY